MTGGLRVVHPYRGGRFGDWQRGTADAVRRNLDYLKEQPEETVMVLSGDHIYLIPTIALCCASTSRPEPI